MKKRNRTHHVWGAFLRIHLNPAGSLSKDRTPVTPAQKKKKLAVLVHVSSILHGSTDPRLTVGLGCLLNPSVLVLGSCSFPSRREKPKNEWAVHLPLRDDYLECSSFQSWSPIGVWTGPCSPNVSIVGCMVVPLDRTTIKLPIR